MLVLRVITRARMQAIVSWLAVTLGCVVGFFACATFGMQSVPLADRDPAWYLRWFDTAGSALLGLGFLVGSLAALRNRRRAGRVFLTVMPVAAFCLAYPDSGYLVWRDGTGWFETPLPVMAIGLTVLFYGVLLLPFFIWPRKKQAVIAFGFAALIAIPVFVYSRWTVALLPRLAGWSLPLLLPGLFWWRTGTSGWPSLLRPRLRSPGKRVLAFLAACVGILCLDIISTLTLCALGTSLFSPDCGSSPPRLRPLSSTHAVFTARVLFAGRSINALIPPHRLETRGDAGDWAIGLVQERFWGMPHWTRLVLLRNYLYWQGESYFIDGRRNAGLLTQFLPIVEGRIGCSRTRSIHYAKVDLRVLRNPLAAGTTRVMGYVEGPEKFVSVIDRPVRPNFIANAQIQVTGPGVHRTISTDSDGIYELDDLAAGDYTLDLQKPETQEVGFFNGEGSPARIRIDRPGLVEKNFELFWNGRIEGQVRDDSGKPASVTIELLSTDGSTLPGYVNSFQIAGKDGSYQFRKVPPGRYLVVVNSSGPWDSSPYDLQYYPAGVLKEQARVFELRAGQRIAGNDFRVIPLQERTAQVRVTWANGSAAENADVCLAYANTNDYESLVGGNCVAHTDRQGFAVIHAYGKTQLRLFAKQSVYRDNQRGPDTFHSRPVQWAADRIPSRIDLVLVPDGR